MIAGHPKFILAGAAVLAVLMILVLGLGIAGAQESGNFWQTSADPPDGTAPELLSPPDSLTINAAHDEAISPIPNVIVPGPSGVGMSSAVIPEGEATRLLSPTDLQTVNPAYEEILPHYEPVQGEGSSAPSSAGS